MNRQFKWFLNLFIVFHVLAVAAAPHTENYLRVVAGPVLQPYLEALGFAVTWKFFAPEPGPSPTFIEYELLDANGAQIRRGEHPHYPDPYFLRDRQNRRIGFTNFLASQASRIDTVLTPWLCKEQGVYSVRLWRVIYPIPRISAVAKGDQKFDDRVDGVRDWIAHSFCAEAAKRPAGAVDPGSNLEAGRAL